MKIEWYGIKSWHLLVIVLGIPVFILTYLCPITITLFMRYSEDTKQWCFRWDC